MRTKTMQFTISALFSLVLTAAAFADQTVAVTVTAKPAQATAPTASSQAGTAPRAAVAAQKSTFAVAAPSADPWVMVQGGRSYLGVDIADVTTERFPALKLKDEHGVEVTAVDQDAPAGKAGVKEHDVILEFNGQRVEGEEQLRRMIRETPSGRTVTLGVSRDGQMQQIKVTLGDRAKVNATPNIYFNRVAPPAVIRGEGRGTGVGGGVGVGVGGGENYTITIPNMQDMMQGIPAIAGGVQIISSRDSYTGMLVENLGQLSEVLGVKEGVLVRNVEKGSAAEKAGFKAGDVIVKVEGQKVVDRMDWRSALRDRKSTKLNVTVVRDKKEQNLTITLPEPKNHDNSRQIWRFNFDDGDWDVDDIDPVNVHAQLEAARSALAAAQQQARAAVEESRMASTAAHKQAMAQLHAQMMQLMKDSEAMRIDQKVALKESLKVREKVMKDLQKELEKARKEAMKSKSI